MKILLFIAVVLLFFSCRKDKVPVPPIEPDYYTLKLEEEFFNSYEVDLDDDGINDVRFSVYFSPSGGGSYSGLTVTGLDSTRVAFIDTAVYTIISFEDYNMVKPFYHGDTLSNSSDFRSSALISEHINLPTPGYWSLDKLVGEKFHVGFLSENRFHALLVEPVHYNSIRIYFDAQHSDNQQPLIIQ